MQIDIKMTPGESTITAAVISKHSRTYRLLAFLAVVWSIGAAFLILQTGMTELSWFSASTVLPANIVLPRQSKASLAHCQEVVRGLPRPAQDSKAARQALYLAWSLGYVVGSADASLTTGLVKRDALNEMLRKSLPITTELGIPPLALPKHGHRALALREFSVFLAEDTPCIATAFEIGHSPTHAALYKFGATVGFVSAYRRFTPQLGDVLTPELRIYGSAAGVPAKLYAPLLGPPARSLKERDAIQSAVNQIDAYIQSR